MLKSASGMQMFGDIVRRKRYFYALLMILLMIGVAELLMEREIIFPEMAALTIGMWIVDKRGGQGEPIYIPGRLRTASSPSST